MEFHYIFCIRAYTLVLCCKSFQQKNLQQTRKQEQMFLLAICLHYFIQKSLKLFYFNFLLSFFTISQQKDVYLFLKQKNDTNVLFWNVNDYRHHLSFHCSAMNLIGRCSPAYFTLQIFKTFYLGATQYFFCIIYFKMWHDLSPQNKCVFFPYISCFLNIRGLYWACMLWIVLYCKIHCV